MQQPVNCWEQCGIWSRKLPSWTWSGADAKMSEEQKPTTVNSSNESELMSLLICLKEIRLGLRLQMLFYGNIGI